MAGKQQANTAAALKRLKTRRQEAAGKLVAAEANLKLAAQAADRERGRLKALDEQISRLTETNGRLIVSEHAKLRLLERRYGVDVEELVSEILTPEVCAQAKLLGNGTYPVNGAHGWHRVVVRDGVVVTVLDVE